MLSEPKLQGDQPRRHQSHEWHAQAGEAILGFIDFTSLDDKDYQAGSELKKARTWM